MTSQVRLPKNWNNIQTMKENNGDARGDKVDAIHDFMRENGIDSTDFENQGELNWPGGAAAQRAQIAAMIKAVNSEMTRTREGSSKDDDVEMGGMGEREDIWVASPPPQSMSRQSSLRINVPPQSPQGFPQAFQQGFQQGSPQPQSPPYFPSPRSDEGGGGIGSGLGAQAAAQTAIIQQRANTFDAYQSHIIELVERIRSMNITTGATANRQALTALMTQDMYGIFFGHDPNGNPTQFYIENGAAPICGMNAQQLVAVASRAKTIDRAIGRFTEEQLGTLRSMYFSLVNRRGNQMAAPFNYIQALMEAVRGVHVAAHKLVQADPLFAEQRAQVARDGDLAVRTIHGMMIAGLVKGGTSVVRSILAKIYPPLANVFNNWVRAVNRDGGMAIRAFENALGQYDRVYQSLPLWAHNCWVLPYAQGTPGYDQTLSRTENKPAADLVTRAIELMNVVNELNQYIRTGQQIPPERMQQLQPDITSARNSLIAAGNKLPTNIDIVNEIYTMAQQKMADARGYVLENPIPCYPRFLTMNEGLNDAGPLLAYYYALHGGQQQFLAEGREELNRLFAINPQDFLQQIKPLLDTLSAVQTSSAQNRRSGLATTMTPRTGAAIRQGGPGATVALRAKLNQLAAALPESQRRYGTLHPGNVPITRAEQLIPKGLTTHEQMAEQNTRRVLQAAQERVAREAFTRLKKENLEDWKQEKYESFKNSLQEMFNPTGRELRSGSGQSLRQNLEKLRQLLNTRDIGNSPLMQVKTRNGFEPVKSSRTGAIRRPALYQILISVGIGNIIKDLNSVFLEPGAQTPGYLSRTKHPVLVLLSRRLTPEKLAGQQYTGLELLLGQLGQELKGLADMNRPLDVGIKNQDGQSVLIPAQFVKQLNAEFQNNEIWRGFITMYTRTLGGVRAAQQRRLAVARKSGQQGSSSITFGQGGGRKKTRKHKKKKKKTRRRKMKRKRTKHHRKRKKHTRKH